MAWKYIVIENEVVMRNVTFHCELVGKSRNEKDVSGGGMYEIDKDNKKIYFYGCSTDFGFVRKEKFISAFPNSLISPSLQGYKVYFTAQNLADVTTDDYLPELIIEGL